MIGDRIRERRLELGLTQEELAAILGYKGKSAVCMVEKDASKGLSVGRVEAFASALNTSPAVLAGWIEPEMKKYLELSEELKNKADAYIDALYEKEMKHDDRR